MPTKDILPLKNTSNVAILNAIKYDATLSYQNRIPDATKANVQDVVRNLASYRPHWNEFVDALVNRIGLVIARNQSWANPLGEFKRGILEYGDTIEEVQTGLLLAHRYDPDREYGEKVLFSQELPDVQSNFHTVDRQEFYKVTINDTLLKRAFLSGSGLSEFAAQLMEAPATSDQWDEFILTCSLFAEYEKNGGFFHVKVPDVSNMESNQADAQGALRKLRAYADNLTFMSTRYNAAHMPMAAKRDELVIFCTPEFQSGIDVNGLAAAFNVSFADAHGRIIPIPQEMFGIDGCQAIMTTRDFFVIADKVFEMTSQYNAASLGTNYFLHRHEVISASRFVPAILFTTNDTEASITINHTVASVAAPTILALSDGTVPTSIARGGMIPLSGQATVTSTPADAVQPTAVVWSLTGANSTRTYITQAGVLHCGGDETATSLTVKATSVYVDPANPRLDSKSATLAIPVTGAMLPAWPEAGSIQSINIKGTEVPGVAVGTLTYTITMPTGTTIKATDVTVGTVNSADVGVTVTKTNATTYTVDIVVDGSDTAVAATYTVTVNLV
jgi:hypothetical protein